MDALIWSVSSLTTAQAATAFAVATLAILASHGSASEGSPWPSAFAVTATLAFAALWIDPAPLANHASTFGVLSWLPATRAQTSQWMTALMTGTATWAIVSAATAMRGSMR